MAAAKKMIEKIEKIQEEAKRTNGYRQWKQLN